MDIDLIRAVAAYMAKAVATFLVGLLVTLAAWLSTEFGWGIEVDAPAVTLWLTGFFISLVNAIIVYKKKNAPKTF